MTKTARYFQDRIMGLPVFEVKLFNTTGTI